MSGPGSPWLEEGRECLIVDLLLALRSTTSVSLLKFTTRWDISRKMEFARAIGEGEGERDLDREPPSLLSADETSRRLMPLAALSLRCMAELVSSVGRVSPSLELCLRSEDDDPSTQCTLDLLLPRSCRCPRLCDPVFELAGLRRPLSVSGVVSVSGGEKISGSSSWAGVVTIVGLRKPDGGVLGRCAENDAGPRDSPTEAAAKSDTFSRGETSLGLG